MYTTHKAGGPRHTAANGLTFANRVSSAAMRMRRHIPGTLPSMLFTCDIEAKSLATSRELAR